MSGREEDEGEDGWWRVVRGLLACAHVEHSSDQHVWVIYVDADFSCSKPGDNLGPMVKV